MKIDDAFYLVFIFTQNNRTKETIYRMPAVNKADAKDIVLRFQREHEDYKGYKVVKVPCQKVTRL